MPILSIKVAVLERGRFVDGVEPTLKTKFSPADVTKEIGHFQHSPEVPNFEVPAHPQATCMRMKDIQSGAALALQDCEPYVTLSARRAIGYM